MPRCVLSSADAWSDLFFVSPIHYFIQFFFFFFFHLSPFPRHLYKSFPNSYFLVKLHVQNEKAKKGQTRWRAEQRPVGCFDWPIGVPVLMGDKTKAPQCDCLCPSP